MKNKIGMKSKRGCKKCAKRHVRGKGGHPGQVARPWEPREIEISVIKLKGENT